jgi:hypothetical protein
MIHHGYYGKSTNILINRLLARMSKLAIQKNTVAVLYGHLSRGHSKKTWRLKSVVFRSRHTGRDFSVFTDR